MNKLFKNFDYWLVEREDLKINATTAITKTHLGLEPMSDAAFGDIQISDFNNYDDFRNKIVKWNMFADLDEIGQNTVMNLLKNHSTRMRDLVQALNKS